jgi:glutamate/tyrosine decarboxylase-like PLP-dependent enzyme
MNGDWFGRRVTPAEVDAFRASWRIFRELLGAHFPEAELVFSASAGTSPGMASINELWPGDDLVDVVGVDLYGGWPHFGDRSIWDASAVPGHRVVPGRRVAPVPGGLPGRLSVPASGAARPDGAARRQPVGDDLARRPRWRWSACRGRDVTVGAHPVPKSTAGSVRGMDTMDPLLEAASAEIIRYRSTLATRRVPAEQAPDAARAAFGVPLDAAGRKPGDVVAQLIEVARPGLMATAGPRYFGFVIGGALPSATAADVLAAGWDQVAFSEVTSPAAAAAEAAAGGWAKELLGIPATASVGFVTGAQAANTVGLAAARHHVLAEAGWDVERRGLAGGPRLRVVASQERHATVDRSLRLLGLGGDVIEPVRADANGAIDVTDLERVLASASPGPTVVCLQSGNVNTGACDDLRAACAVVRRHGGWVHVDGAFGLWAAASPSLRHLVDGVELADSWGCDAHKWLNVPYDSALAFCSRPQVHATAMSYTAAYLVGSNGAGSPSDYTAESSRRARGFAVWAALQELGRDGVAALVDRCCALARRFAGRLAEAGFEVANDVVLNQVLVGFGDDARTAAVIAAVQRDGTCWMGGTTWRGRHLMRISVSNHATTADDVDTCADAIIRLAAEVG